MKWFWATTAKNNPLRRHWRVFLAASLLMIAAAGGASIYLSLRAQDADKLMGHAATVWRTTERLQGSMLDAETGERGFLLTRNEAYLDPYWKGTAAVPGLLAALHSLLSDNPVQRARVKSVEQMIGTELVELRAAIALERRGEHDAALQITNTDRGKAIMDRIRRELDTISTEEMRALERNRSEARTLRALLPIWICISLLIAGLIVAYLAYAANGAMMVIRERTKRLEEEIKLRHSAEDTLRQVQKLEAIGQLSGGIAHDFNNLLTIIIGNLDTVQRRLLTRPADVEIGKPVGHAMQGARSAAQLTHRLLAFSRRQMLTPVALDLNRLVASMSDMLRRTLGETIHIETVLAAGLWLTSADANQVESTLINLCLNARDAMPDGGKLTIETSNTYLDEGYAAQFGDVTPGQYAMLSVTDTGCGMGPELLARIFEPFFTTKKEGEGSGLGLAMVHGFVKQSGGHVRIYSEPSHGTTVKIYLPRLMQAGAAAPAPKPDNTTPAARPHETVLLVEDNEGVRAFAKAALEDVGYTVYEAADAAAALETLDTMSRMDLLLTDVVLPETSGRELAARITERRNGAKVLFMTGYTPNAIIHHGRLDPGVNLLNKPFTQQALARKVREVLDRA